VAGVAVAAAVLGGVVAFAARSAAVSDTPWMAADITPARTDAVTLYHFPVGQVATISVDWDNNGNLDDTWSGEITGDPTTLSLGTDKLQPFSRIHATAQGVGIDLQAATLDIWRVDAPTDEVAGRAPAGATVTVNIGAHAGGTPVVTTTADSNGGWQVDFTGTANVGPATWVTARVSDPDGDETRYSAQCPDEERPQLRLTSPATPFALAATATLSYRGSDNVGVVNYDVRWRAAAYDAPFGAWHYPDGWQRTTRRTRTLTGLKPGREYCLTARARDAAGNVSTWAPPWCVARPLDDTALAVTSGWTRHADRRYYLRTYTATTAAGARLTRTGARVDRLAVVATTCPTCGAVLVRVGGAAVASWSLHTATTERRVVLVSRRFAARTGTVTVRVISAGKRVEIDGLGIRRG
jgi:hypothetical protein